MFFFSLLLVLSCCETSPPPFGILTFPPVSTCNLQLYSQLTSLFVRHLRLDQWLVQVGQFQLPILCVWFAQIVAIFLALVICDSIFDLRLYSQLTGLFVRLEAPELGPMACTGRSIWAAHVVRLICADRGNGFCTCDWWFYLWFVILFSADWPLREAPEIGPMACTGRSIDQWKAQTLNARPTENPKRGMVESRFCGPVVSLRTTFFSEQWTEKHRNSSSAKEAGGFSKLCAATTWFFWCQPLP